MPAAEPPILSSESGLVKMEDRKRPAADNNDSAPPLKKQATTVNGGSKPHPDADMPWKDDLEVGRVPILLKVEDPGVRVSLTRVPFNTPIPS